MSTEPTSTGWHAREADDVLHALGSSSNGLTDDEARARLEEHGPNQLPLERLEPLLSKLKQIHELVNENVQTAEAQSR